MVDFSQITIGKDTYTLTFPLQEMMMAESALGKPLQRVFTRTVQASDGVKMPEYEIRDLIILFRYGLRAKHPAINQAQADELLAQYFGEGTNLIAQAAILYTLLGKALGFFRTEIDIQQKATKVFEKIAKKNSLS